MVNNNQKKGNFGREKKVGFFSFRGHNMIFNNLRYQYLGVTLIKSYLNTEEVRYMAKLPKLCGAVVLET